MMLVVAVLVAVACGVIVIGRFGMLVIVVAAWSAVSLIGMLGVMVVIGVIVVGMCHASAWSWSASAA